MNKKPTMKVRYKSICPRCGFERYVKDAHLIGYVVCEKCARKMQTWEIGKG